MAKRFGCQVEIEIGFQNHVLSELFQINLMCKLLKQITVLVFVLAGCLGREVLAADLDTIGASLLWTVTTNLNGAGVRVAQAEAEVSATPPTWEVNPAATGQPANLFTYYYGDSPYLTVSTANTYPNSLGVESGHSDAVGANFFGMPGGVATNVFHVDNYEANTFYNYYVLAGRAIPARVVNQSFTFGSYDTTADQSYDNFAAANNTLFISGAGVPNTNVFSPATCYNGIGVGVFNNSGSPYGPTPDGRSKPDITAPNTPDNQTSYTSPRVAGAAALLLQAGTRGDGGPSTAAATDIRTLKALLLNGAIKPADWTNSPSAPLHPRYGAGVLNVFNSYKQLTGGIHGYIVSTTVSTGGAHPPTGASGTVSTLSGWDFNTNTSSFLNDSVNHYYFNITNSTKGAAFTATATLVWNRHQNQTGINNLDLFLYDTASGNVVLSSTSTVDNVEHLFVPRLPPGRYDLQVWKAGGPATVSTAEPYALAFEFFSTTLTKAGSGANTTVSWPIYPTGFVLESANSLSPPVAWSANNPAPVVVGNQNVVSLNATNASQFFRLRR
jgi:hypothetical protein